MVGPHHPHHDVFVPLPIIHLRSHTGWAHGKLRTVLCPRPRAMGWLPWDAVPLPATSCPPSRSLRTRGTVRKPGCPAGRTYHWAESCRKRIIGVFFGICAGSGSRFSQFPFPKLSGGRDGGRQRIARPRLHEPRRQGEAFVFVFYQRDRMNASQSYQQPGWKRGPAQKSPTRSSGPIGAALRGRLPRTARGCAADGRRSEPCRAAPSRAEPSPGCWSSPRCAQSFSIKGQGARRSFFL